jgi:hypothetical protein
MEKSCLKHKIIHLDQKDRIMPYRPGQTSNYDIFKDGLILSQIFRKCIPFTIIIKFFDYAYTLVLLSHMDIVRANIL